MIDGGSFAFDERAQGLALEIAKAQGRADSELATMAKVKSPALKVGCAMQHVRELMRADRLRAEFAEHSGMQS